MIIQIICNVVMFSAYILNIVYFVIILIKHSKSLPSIHEGIENLSAKEKLKHYKNKFVNKFISLLFICFGFMLIGITTCLCDGLSDTQNYIVVPFGVGLLVYSLMSVFLITYTTVLRKKYKIDLISHSDPIHTKANVITGLMCICLLVALLFAIHSGVVAYTFALLFG